MALLRRRRPLHEELARAGGLSYAFDGGASPGLAAEVPGWDGLQRGEPGIHGVPRARRWDTVTTCVAPGIRGDSVQFAVTGDGTVLVEEDEPDDAVRALADAVERTLAPPYRAEAVRRTADVFGVAARRILIVEAPELRGEEAELVVGPDGWSLQVDGRHTLRAVPALEAVGADLGPERVVRAWRLDGNLWEAEATPL